MTESEFHVVSTIDERFETDVLVRSQLGLVIVDFWADWCAPCRMLTPILEQLAEEYRDRLTLVKAETEANSQAAQLFGVAGIPAVFAVLDGKTIDAFQGALPEPALREWIEKCLHAETFFRLRSLVLTDPSKAEQELREMLSDDSATDEAKVLLVQALFEQKQFDACRELLLELEARGFLEPECQRILAELSLQQKADVDVDALRAQVEANPSDRELHLRLAEVLAAQKESAEAMEICLKLVAEDRKGTGEAARKLMLDVFQVEGDDSELTHTYRRKLSMALY